MKGKKIVILLILFFFSSHYIKGIDVSQYRFHSIQATPYYHGIQNIAKDSIGRIWYSGRDALFMYDGNSFHQMDEYVSIKSPDLYWVYNQLFVDKYHQLYVASSNGLLKFNYGTMDFKFVLKGFVNSITQEEDGVVWINRNNKLEMLSQNEGQVLKSFFMPKDSSTITSIYQNISYFDKFIYFPWKGKIYRVNRTMDNPALFCEINVPNIIQILGYNDFIYVLSEKNGLFIINKNGKIVKHIDIPSEKDKSVSLKKLYIDRYNVLWVGTQSGLFLLDTKTYEHVLLQNEQDDIHSLPHNSIWSIYPDPDGGVWVSTFGGKLAYMSFDDSQVNYRHVSSNGLNNPIVSCFGEDKDGNIWIGTEGGGLNRWDRSNGKYTYYTSNENNGLNSNLVKSISFNKEKNKLLIAAYNGGICEYNLKTQRFTDLNIHYPNNPLKPFNTYDFAMESDSGIWVSDADMAEALYYKNLHTGKIINVKLPNIDAKKSKYTKVECIYRDTNEFIYLFTRQGLFKMNAYKHAVTHQYMIDSNSFAVNDLRCYAATSNSDIWAGTMGGGVNLLTKDGEYINFNVSNGFPATIVFSIVEDAKTNNIWFATNNGFIYYDTDSDKFIKTDFIAPSLYGSFYPRACYQTSEGEMFFGGTNGFIYFNPEKIKYNTQKPEVFFTDFYINNIRILCTTKKSPLQKDISAINMNKKNVVKLSYKQANIGISFFSNSYLQPEKNQFACRLVNNGSEEWQILPPGQNSIQYFNLPAGSYVFEIKAANNDGVWGDKITSLYFQIAPPPWLSVWAYILYAFIILSAGYFLWKYFTDKKIFRHKLAMEKAKEARMKELIQLRINFFTNISHDLKTPLTLIVNPLKRLKETIPLGNDSLIYTQMIEDNVKRIQRMINQLLQFRQIESKKVTLNYQPGNLVNHIMNIFSLFMPFAQKKGIEVNTDIYTSRLYVSFDFDIMEKIFSNLFSNAIKYTPEGETISLIIRKATEQESLAVKEKKQGELNTEYITFEVINTGIEIDETQQKELFTSFSRLSDRRLDFEESYGLGLSIVKELVSALSGVIKLDNRNKNKVLFRLTLPFTKIEEDNSAKLTYSYEYTYSELDAINTETEDVTTNNNRKPKKYDIVIIEDDSSLRVYMEKELSESYNVYTATNGVEGLSLVKRIKPTIVITDLMMPEMNGFDVCHILKTNIETSHIPIIILSALGNNTDHKVKGLKEGADVFIEKPFDIAYLTQQIENFIKSREQLKELYSKKYTVEPTQLTVSSIDEEFLKRAVTCIESNIQNQEYDVEAFVSDMNISRTLLYQKISEITGMTIKEFILDMRLKRSAQLLKDSQYTISEIAFMTGFNDASYFSVCFKKHYNISPSKFRNS
ncbi:MAG: two-component regulator propeller domain-containing protein [Dysgonomonas sp.]